MYFEQQLKDYALTPEQMHSLTALKGQANPPLGWRSGLHSDGGVALCAVRLGGRQRGDRLRQLPLGLWHVPPSGAPPSAAAAEPRSSIIAGGVVKSSAMGGSPHRRCP